MVSRRNSAAISPKSFSLNLRRSEGKRICIERGVLLNLSLAGFLAMLRRLAAAAKHLSDL